MDAGGSGLFSFCVLPVDEGMALTPMSLLISGKECADSSLVREARAGPDPCVTLQWLPTAWPSWPCRPSCSGLLWLALLTSRLVSVILFSTHAQLLSLPFHVFSTARPVSHMLLLASCFPPAA